MPEALWLPSPDRIAKTQLARFMEFVRENHGVVARDYDELWQWSVDESGKFWRSVWDFCGVAGEPGERVTAHGEALIDSVFFPDASLNFAENLLRGAPEGVVLVFHGEDGERREVTREALVADVSRMQQALRAQGVGSGDRVAGYMPNLPETVVAMLAATSLGAVWSSCSPDFGHAGIRDRFAQIEPSVMFVADGYRYGGRSFGNLETAALLLDDLPSLTRIVVVPFLEPSPAIEGLGSKGILWEQFVAGFRPEPPEFTPMCFRDPLFILFSSGTTGLPKCIVHGVGGSLLQLLKEHRLQSDIQPGDRLLYFTTCGWMMWNWLVGAMASGASVILYEGNPGYPDNYRLANIVESERVTHFGTSARFIDACSKAGVRPIDSHDFSALRTVLSTGSPLSEDGFRYIYSDWKADVCLSSIAGGTDIMGCFVGGNPIGPVYAGQCQKRQLGMDVKVFDGDGRPVQEEQGELVCTTPFPSMPLYFLNDPDRKRYRDAYFASYDNAWCQGDFVELTAEGGMVFFGRSDATLNPGGVRIGTAEIYRQLEHVDEVLEALVIGQNWDNDVRVILFVKLREGCELTPELVQRMKSEIRSKASPRHVPARILALPDLPRTRSGKLTELAVRDVVHGRPIKNVEALANPESLEFFADIPELQT